jgi:hypothetical protein
LHTSTDAGTVARFVREARAVAALDHPNIVRAIDIDKDDRFHFLVMEYVDGIDLQDLVSKHGRLDTGRACHYVAQAALGLQHAHEAGWVHRDIKAGNLLVDRGGTVKILDMGLARLTTDHTDQLTKQFDDAAIIGTADYLAPEQSLPGEKVDARADIYSLGFTLYFLLTGKTPFGTGSVLQKIVAHQVKEPKPISAVRPDLPKDLTLLIEKMMAKSPAHRPQTAREVAAKLMRMTSKKTYPLQAGECAEHCPRVRQLLQASPAQSPLPVAMPNDTEEDEDTAPWTIDKPGRRMPILLLAGGATAFFFFAVVAAGLLWWLAPRLLGTASANNADASKKDVAVKKDESGPTETVAGVVTADEAIRHVNKICTVRMPVRSHGLSKNQKMLFLNSQVNYKAPTNFTIVVHNLGVEGGPELEELAASFDKKTIRVTGKVTVFNEQRQIVVDSPQHIEIVAAGDDNK